MEDEKTKLRKVIDLHVREKQTSKNSNPDLEVLLVLEIGGLPYQGQQNEHKTLQQFSPEPRGSREEIICFFCNWRD